MSRSRRGAKFSKSKTLFNKYYLHVLLKPSPNFSQTHIYTLLRQVYGPSANLSVRVSSWRPSSPICFAGYQKTSWTMDVCRSPCQPYIETEGKILPKLSILLSLLWIFNPDLTNCEVNFYLFVIA